MRASPSLLAKQEGQATPAEVHDLPSRVQPGTPGLDELAA